MKTILLIPFCINSFFSKPQDSFTTLDEDTQNFIETEIKDIVSESILAYFEAHEDYFDKVGVKELEKENRALFRKIDQLEKQIKSQNKAAKSSASEAATEISALKAELAEFKNSSGLFQARTKASWYNLRTKVELVQDDLAERSKDDFLPVDSSGSPASSESSDMKSFNKFQAETKQALTKLEIASQIVQDEQSEIRQKLQEINKNSHSDSDNDDDDDDDGDDDVQYSEFKSFTNSTNAFQKKIQEQVTALQVVQNLIQQQQAELVENSSHSKTGELIKSEDLLNHDVGDKGIFDNLSDIRDRIREFKNSTNNALDKLKIDVSNSQIVLRHVQEQQAELVENSLNSKTGKLIKPKDLLAHDFSIFEQFDFIRDQINEIQSKLHKLIHDVGDKPIFYHLSDIRDQISEFKNSTNNALDKFKIDVSNSQIVLHHVQEQQAELVNQSNNQQIVSNLVQEEQSDILKKIAANDEDDKLIKDSVVQLEQKVEQMFRDLREEEANAFKTVGNRVGINKAGLHKVIAVLQNMSSGLKSGLSGFNPDLVDDYYRTP